MKGQRIGRRMGSVVVTLALLAGLGCGGHAAAASTTSHATTSSDGRSNGRPFPFEQVSVRFLGLRELAPDGGDVELGWAIDHPDWGPRGRLTAFPTPGAQSSVDVVEMRVTRSPTRTTVNVRLALGDGIPAASQLGTTVGLRLERWASGALTRWTIPPRTLVLARRRPGLGATGPRDPSFDGSLEIELRVAPDVPTLDGIWVMEAGTTYEVQYRVHNRTEEPVRVRITARSPGLESVEEVRIIPGEGSTDVDLSTTPTASACGSPEPCHVLVVRKADADEVATDAVALPIIVR